MSKEKQKYGDNNEVLYYWENIKEKIERELLAKGQFIEYEHYNTIK